MICRDCKYMKLIENGSYICSNENSNNFMEYTGICCEDDCEDGEEDD